MTRHHTGGHTPPGVMTHGQIQRMEIVESEAGLHGTLETTPQPGQEGGRRSSGMDHLRVHHMHRDMMTPWHGGRLALNQRRIEPGRSTYDHTHKAEEAPI